MLTEIHNYNAPVAPVSRTCCDCFCSDPMKALYKTAAKIVFFVIAGAIAHVLYAPIAPPFFALAVTMLASRIIIQILSACNYANLNRLIDGVVDINTRFSKLQIIVFIAALALTCFSIIAGTIVAGMLGFVSGFVITVDEYRRNQDSRQAGFDRNDRANVVSMV